MSKEVKVDYKMSPKIISLMAPTKGDLQEGINLLVAGINVIAFNDPEDKSLVEIYTVLIPKIFSEALKVNKEIGRA